MASTLNRAYITSTSLNIHAPLFRPTAPKKAQTSGPPSLPPRPTPGHPLYRYVVSASASAEF